jgi:hypothetical protein
MLLSTILQYSVDFVLYNHTVGFLLCSILFRFQATEIHLVKRCLTIIGYLSHRGVRITHSNTCAKISMKKACFDVRMIGKTYIVYIRFLYFFLYLNWSLSITLGVHDCFLFSSVFPSNFTKLSETFVDNIVGFLC